MTLTKLELYTIRDALLGLQRDDDGDLMIDEEAVSEALEIVESALTNYELNNLEDRF